MHYSYRDCVAEVISVKGFGSSLGKFVSKVAVPSEIRPKLEKQKIIMGSETLEVINSFRTPFSIPIARMEQVGFYLKIFLEQQCHVIRFIRWI